MKFLSGLSLLFIVALSNAAPRSPSLIYRTELEDEEPEVAIDIFPLQTDDFDDEGRIDYGGEQDGAFYDHNPSPVQGVIDLELNEMNPIIQDARIRDIVFRDLEERINEDIFRMQQDMSLFQKLFGIPRVADDQSPWLMPWGDSSDENPAFTPDDYDSSNGSDSSESSSSEDDSLFPFNDRHDEGSLFAGFPFLGLDRPLFSNLPKVPGVGFANPEDLPDNYNNKTHHVHDINGTQVVVNNTINKQSGDNFNSFFHHQVIHYQPGDDSESKVPEQIPDEVTEIPEIVVPLDEEDEEEIDSILPAEVPEVDYEIDTDNTISRVFPEVAAEINSLTGDEEDFGNSYYEPQQSQRLSARSLGNFNPIVFPNDQPKRVNYVSNNLSEEDEAEDLGEEFGEEATRAPDLSSDTRVNRIHVDKQGMTRVDPDAEIFNYGLVLKELQPREEDN